ncbi:hypothetical protein [Salisaeta icosahedral phage 1]|uniref:hypothetical protein n=1 Tax=Salisaeta icosahedral phage 1 TaxID=1183239 RepID=UPI00025EA919|nr:hypothetical protein A322_gp12 [Salisaeta icosahedral phage 1]AFJ21467.1 hypothetical protein [Salisaeta icosahedral phage 1]
MRKTAPSGGKGNKKATTRLRVMAFKSCARDDECPPMGGHSVANPDAFAANRGHFCIVVPSLLLDPDSWNDRSHAARPSH